MEKNTKTNRSISSSAPLPEEKEGYIEQRLHGQMSYYHRKSTQLRKEYHLLSTLNILVTSAIPVLTLAVEDWSFCKYLIAVLSAITAILSAILLLHKTAERYSDYRKTYEELKKEEIYYLNRAEKYKDKETQECGALFIQQCEELMSAEHHTWAEFKYDK